MDGQAILGVDIGGTKSAVALARQDGTILQRRSEATRPDLRTPQETLERLATMAREMMAEANLRSGDVRGIGVSCGGPLDTKTGTIFAPPNLPDYVAGPRVGEWLGRNSRNNDSWQ